MRARKLIAAAAAFPLVVAAMGVAHADNVYNNLDTSIDATAESMALTAGGANGSTTLLVQPAGGDGKEGCNLTGQSTLTVAVASSDTAVATVSPSSVTFDSCGATRTLTVTPRTAGTATVALRETANNTGGTFDLAPATFTVTVASPGPTDTTAPVIIPTVTGTLGNNGWYTSNVSVTWDVTDGESAISSRNGCDAVGITADQTSITYTCSATSAGGTASRSVSVKRDANGPVITPGDVNETSWSNATRSEDFTASDWPSGLANSADASFTLSASDESLGASTPTTDSRTVTDAAGNSTTRSLSALIDKSGPAVSPADVVAGSTWHNSDVTQTFSASDDLSGLANTADESFTLTASLESANASTPTTVSRTVLDSVGNATTRSLSAFIDRTAPTDVTFVGGPAAGGSYYGNTLPAQPTCTATEPLSGLAGCEVTGYSPAPGTHVMTATATDRAGNEATATRTYTVKELIRSGFYAPVDMGKTWNTIKGGNTVPLKFEVFELNNGVRTELTTVGQLGATFRAEKVSCESKGVEDAIETFGTAGQTELRYDATGGQFIQNWKTPTGSGCYAATLTTADGLSITAFFKTLK